jgi:hypothetical protein
MGRNPMKKLHRENSDFGRRPRLPHYHDIDTLISAHKVH